MEIFARDVMDTRFETLSAAMTIQEAVEMIRGSGERTGRRAFGMMVTGRKGEIAGMLSMYDILLFLSPKHIHLWGEMEDIDTSGFLTEACRRAGTVLVGDIMARDLITVSPGTHLLMIADIMIRKHVRRIPVVEEGRVRGIVYISDVFMRLSDGFSR